MINKLYDNESLSKQFMIFIILQPIIDIYRLFVGNAIEIAGISLVELINIFLIGYLGVLFVLNQKKLKTFVPAILYAIILCIYLIFHCYNMLNFDTTIITGTSINVFVEIYVILRAYVLPIMLLYMMIHIRTTQERFLKTTVSISVFISSVIVITNVFKISYISYASNLKEKEMIYQNIFEWFTKQPPSDLNLITSKGWFYSGNQIGLILLMLLPIVVYYAMRKQKIYGYFFVALQVVAMIMVATKTAAFGSMLVLVVMLVLLLVFSIIEKQWIGIWKNLLAIMLILVMGLILLIHSPVIRMMNLQSLSYEESEEEKALESKVDELSQGEFDEESFIEFFNECYYIYGVQEEYIKLLPVAQYPDFWFSVVTDESKRQINFREFKQRLYEVVATENNNPQDMYLGIGYTSNFPYVEKDISAQNVWFGWIGTIVLLGPFFFLFVYLAIKILLNMKEHFSFWICTLGLAICATTVCTLIAGHLFGNLFPIAIYIYIMAQLKHSVITKN